MNIACIGGGPAGLYFAISMKLRQPETQITIFERNRANDTFGWGVVLSDETLDNLEQNDPVSARSIREHFAYWDDIACVYGGERTVSTGHGFCGIGRKQLLILLQARARELGVELQFETEVEDIADLQRRYDLVVASDGLNSQARKQYPEQFRASVASGACKFVWLGTHQKFDDAFTFIFEQTEKGWVWAHAYQFSDDTATFIVECSEQTWQAYGFGEMSQQQSMQVCEQIFKDHLGGNALMSNANHIRGSAWINFPKVLCDTWWHDNIVLMGDAAASAHFSIGSGTKLALESAISLATHVNLESDLQTAFEKYQDQSKLEVLRLQSAARNSVEWFENIERYFGLDPVQFNYALLTRSQRISHENLRARDASWLQSAERWFAQHSSPENTAGDTIHAPMFTPYRLRDLQLDNRVVVSPMAQYKAENGCPTDWHFVHYAERAKGGAGLVFTEMTCVSANGRITPACPGLYTDEHVVAWRRLCDFIHNETRAAVCCQLGHAGRKGSTRVGWDKMDAPLAKDNWPLLSASAVPWSADNATPDEINHEQMQSVLDEFVAATLRAADAGFDMIELHAAHGYLISSFISPLSNTRCDEFGGSLDNRLRYPLQVFRAMRKAWPAEKPMSVRVSATDWVGEQGITEPDAVEIARRFKAAGADIIDVSAGQTSIDAQPVYGRMFQTPFSDRIRNEADIATMAVGNIYEADHVNSILMAGRADLVCIGRPHLADPYWTLHNGSKIGDRQQAWPLPYLAGRDQLWRLSDRELEAGKAPVITKGAS